MAPRPQATAQRQQQAEHQPDPRQPARASASQRVARLARCRPGGGVGAEADEGGLAERGQAADAGEQHQAERDQLYRPM